MMFYLGSVRAALQLTGFAMLLSACTAQTNDAQMVSLEPAQSFVGAPERPLPVLGQIDAVYDDEPILWQTLDFSLGAIDPSASVRRFDGDVILTVEGYLPGQDFEEGYGRLRIEAPLMQGAASEPVSGALISIIDELGFDGPRYVSGPEATLQLTQILPASSDTEVMGSIAGTFAGTLCRATSRTAPPDLSDCKPILGSFDTQGSFEGLR